MSMVYCLKCNGDNPETCTCPKAFTKQPKRARKLLEKDIQKACVAYAKSKGFWARKFSSMSQRSVPDYLFGKRWDTNRATYGASVKWAEEFKSPGNDATDAQKEEHRLMREAGWDVYPHTGMNGQADIDAFKARIDALEEQYG